MEPWKNVPIHYFKNKLLNITLQFHMVLADIVLHQLYSYILYNYVGIISI